MTQWAHIWRQQTVLTHQFTPSVYVVLKTSQSIADDIINALYDSTIVSWTAISISLDIDFIHSHIHDRRLCKQNMYGIASNINIQNNI